MSDDEDDAIIRMPILSEISSANSNQFRARTHSLDSRSTLFIPPGSIRQVMAPGRIFLPFWRFGSGWKERGRRAAACVG